MPGDCFITRSIPKEVVPEMVPLLILQHQIPNFRIKHGMFHIETTHINSLSLSLSVPSENVHYNAKITEINSFIDAKPAPD